MDAFLQHLINLSSTDSNIRKQAEDLKEEQLKNNFASYLHNLSSTLVNEKVDENARQLAGIMIKNALSSPNETILRQNQQKWYNIANEHKEAIKQQLLSGIGSPSNAARKGACSAVASIGIAELIVGEWLNLIPDLGKAVQQNNKVLKEGALLVIGIICEDIDPIPEHLEKMSGDILNAIACCASNTSPLEVRLASIRAMYGALTIVSNNFHQKAQRDYIMGIICNACKDAPPIQTEALSCLVKVAELYYDFLDQTYLSAIWEISSQIINTDNDGAFLAIEFWSTIAEIERDIEDSNYSKDDSNPEFSKKILNPLIPPLCHNLLKQVEDTSDSEEWNIAAASAACITILAESTMDEIFTIIKPFIELIKSDNWRQREASTMAFGSILNGPCGDDFKTFMLNIISVLMEHLNSDNNDCVRATSAWAISRVADVHPDIVSRDTKAVLGCLVSGLSNEDEVIAYYCCVGILNILNSIYIGRNMEPKNELSEIFVPLFEKLASAGDRDDGSKLRITAYEAMHALIEVAPMDCIDNIKRMIPAFLDKLEKTFNVNVDIEDQRALQAYIPLVLQTITKRIGGDVTPFAEDMYTKFIKIFETRKAIVDEAMNAISTLFSECPKIIPHVINQFTNYFLGAIQNYSETSVLKSGLICLGAMCDTLEQNIYLFDKGNLCNHIIGNLTRHLQNPDVDQDLRPLIITSFADLALAIGPHYTNYFSHTMNVLSAASDITIDSNETSEDFVDYVIALREAILEAYPPVLDSLVEAGNPSDFVPHLAKLILFMQSLWNETQYRTRSIVSSMIGIIGDILKHVVPVMNKEDIARLCTMQFLTDMLDHGINRSPNAETRNIAYWARQQFDSARRRLNN